jgi:hypothetical protein
MDEAEEADFRFWYEGIARPRATKDLDLFIEPSVENAEKILAAIRDFFGGEDLGFTVQDLTAPGLIVQLGVAPARIDLLSRLASRSAREHGILVCP